MKNFKGKAIYNPSGKAGEYSYWACNFYTGCSNGCEYCYCKKGILAGVMGQDKPQLKKCFKNETHALEVFEKELKQNLSELQKHGLFFSFTTDPMLPETRSLTLEAAVKCCSNGVRIQILTKRADISLSEIPNMLHYCKENIAFLFTLTGKDNREPGASTNVERISRLKEFHNAGFKTGASIEPIIDLESSMEMIESTLGFCDIYKIGLESGKRLPKAELLRFVGRVCMLANRHGVKLYWKDSITRITGPIINEATVSRDYNIFTTDNTNE